MSEQTISLQLTAEAVDSYCRDLERRTSSVEKRIVSLDALRTFLAVQLGTAEQANPEYEAIRRCLDNHFDRARHQLHQQQSGQLIEALMQKNLSRLAALYQALSRDAFWQLMEEVKSSLGRETSEGVGLWSMAWLDDVKRRSAELSPYPDAIDFKAVGIDVVDYSLMRDIASCFATLMDSTK